MGFKTWTSKASSSLNTTEAEKAQLNLESNDQGKEANPTNKLSPDTKICDTRNLRLLIGYHNIWMVTVGGALVYYVFAMGMIHFYPNASMPNASMPNSSIRVENSTVPLKDPLSGLETEVDPEYKNVVTWSITGISLAWIGSLIQIIMYAVVKVKPGFYFEVCLIQTVAFFVVNVVIVGLSPIWMGICLGIVAWPLYVFGIGISLKVIRELPAMMNEIPEEPKKFTPVLGKEEQKLYEAGEPMHGVYTIWNGDEIRLCDKPTFRTYMKEFKENAK